MKRVWLLSVLLGLGFTQQATNGQQIAFAGVRFVVLEVQGLNQDNKMALWKSKAPLNTTGVTVIFIEGWWWKGEVRIKAKLMDGQQFECTTGPLSVGSVISIVVAQKDGGCLGDATNSSAMARSIENWLRKNRSAQKQALIRSVTETAHDGWACLNALAQDDTNLTASCQGVPEETIRSLK